MLPVYEDNIIMEEDWNDFVSKIYGKTYSFQQQEGCQEAGEVFFRVPQEVSDYPNDSMPEVINGDIMGVAFESWLKRPINHWGGLDSDRPFLRLFWNRNFYPKLQVLANDLHKRGLLSAGDYQIQID